MNRSISADLIKSLAIFGVVFSHSALILGCNSFVSENSSWIFKFCVPSFIIIWAYFFENSYSKKNIQERKKYLITRFKQLFIVFFSWSSIYFFITVNWSEISFSKLLTAHFSGYGFTGQYFFIVLFQLIILYPILRWIYSKMILRISLLILIVIIYFIYGYNFEILPNIILKLGDRPFLFWIPYVFVGIAYAKVSIPKISSVFIFSILLISIEFSILKFYNMGHSHYITPAVLISSSLFCLSILQSNLQLKNELIVKSINYIGRNTMTIFVANPLIVLFLSKMIPKNLITNPSIFDKIFMPFASTLFVFIICLLLAELINKTKLKGILN